MDPVRRRLDELSDQYALPPEASGQLEALLDVVAEDETAPTTVTDPAQAVDVHIADSLTGLEIDALMQAATIADLGAGAGFPGLVLAAALPQARVALVESLGRKCAFLERAARAAGIANVDVACARAEEWHDGIDRNDAVTVRAVAPLSVLCEYAAPLLHERGVLIAYKGRRDTTEEADAHHAASVLGLELEEIRPVSPHGGADHRHLYVYSKVRPTPPKFPRRAGMARKRPLSSTT